MASQQSRDLFRRLVDSIAASVQRRQAQRRPGAWLGNATVLVVGLLLLWGTLRLASLLKTSAGTFDRARRPVEAAARVAAADASDLTWAQPRPPEPVEIKTRATLDETRVRAAKVRQQLLVDRADEVARIVADAETKLRAFESRVRDLWAGADGKLLAATEVGVERFVALVESGRPSVAELDALSRSIAALVEPLRKAASDREDLAVPGEDVGKLIDALRSDATRMHAAIAQAVDQLDTLLGLARRAPAPSDLTLREAVDARRRAQREEALRQQALILDEQRRKDDAARAEAERALREAAAKEEREQVLAKARDIERATRERAAEREAEAERRRLVAKARDPRVRHMLWPFLAQGYALPNGFTGNGYSLYRKGDAEGPMSFGALRANGALERTVEGRARLVQIAVGMPEEGNDRPRWNFPRNAAFWSRETMRFVTDAQDLLIELGPVMVQEGMLAE